MTEIEVLRGEIEELKEAVRIQSETISAILVAVQANAASLSILAEPYGK